LEQKSLDYHKAAAVRARKLLADATTPWLKGWLRAQISRYERTIAEIETASPDSAAARPNDAGRGVQNK
jgi:hypothetical protein